ncbi:MAG: hypothetical protein ABR572_03840 [Cryomorphaceae bacterium]
MTDHESWQMQYRSIAEDPKAEALLYLLAGLKRDSNDFLFFLNGGFKRIFRNDVAAIHGPGHHKHKNDRTLIEVNRRGLYDQFPEFLFHKSKSNKHFKSIADLKDEREHQEHLAYSARRFFWPMDDQLLKVKSDILGFEITMGQFRQKRGRDYLRKFWDIPDYFNDMQARFLAMILPSARDISVNLQWLETAVSMVMQLPFRIRKTLRTVERECTESNFFLGRAQLGIDGVLGVGYHEDVYQLTFAVGPVGMEVANKFAEYGEYTKRLNYLCDHLTPVDMETETEIIPEPDFSFTLFEKHQLCSILGVSSILSDPK